MERDWFLERLQLIAHDILTAVEREEKDKRRWNNMGPLSPSMLTNAEMASANHLEEVLTQGIQVRSNSFFLYHFFNFFFSLYLDIFKLTVFRFIVAFLIFFVF